MTIVFQSTKTKEENASTEIKKGKESFTVDKNVDSYIHSIK